MRAEKEGARWEREHGLTDKKHRVTLSNRITLIFDGYQENQAIELKRQSVQGTAAEKVPMAVLKLQTAISEGLIEKGRIILCGKFWHSYPWLKTFLSLATPSITIELCTFKHHNH